MQSIDITWSAQEARRFSLRAGLFVRRGLPELDAELLAERCVARDRSSDWRDMHACAECRHLQDGHRCATFRHGALPLAVLHRCPGFDWQVPRTQGQA